MVNIRNKQRNLSIYISLGTIIFVFILDINLKALIENHQYYEYIKILLFSLLAISLFFSLKALMESVFLRVLISIIVLFSLYIWSPIKPSHQSIKISDTIHTVTFYPYRPKGHTDNDAMTSHAIFLLPLNYIPIKNPSNISSVLQLEKIYFSENRDYYELVARWRCDSFIKGECKNERDAHQVVFNQKNGIEHESQFFEPNSRISWDKLLEIMLSDDKSIAINIESSIDFFIVTSKCVIEKKDFQLRYDNSNPINRITLKCY